MKHSLFMAPLVVAATALAARADLQYTETMGFGSEAGAFSTTTTHWLKDGFERTETNSGIAGMEMKSLTLEQCKDGKIYHLAPELKLYSVSKPGDMPALPSGAMMGSPRPPKNPPKAGTGTSTLNFSLQDLGQEKIAGVESRHYGLTMTVTNTGCAGNGTQTMKMETWVANIPMPRCDRKQSAGGSSTPTRPAAVESGCKVTTEIKGDVASLGKAFQGLTMRMKMDAQGHPIIREVTSLSQAPIPDSMFEVPAGYREVSEMELNQAKSKAMMQKLLGPGAGAGMPNIGALGNLGKLGGMANMPGMGAPASGGDSMGGFLGSGLSEALQSALGGNLPF